MEDPRRFERYDSEAKYSQVVSIHAPETDVDLYATVESMVESQVENSVQTRI